MIYLLEILFIILKVSIKSPLILLSRKVIYPNFSNLSLSVSDSVMVSKLA